MNDHDAPTRELFDSLGRHHSGEFSLRWYNASKYPWIADAFGDGLFELPTIAHLRAACLLLDIPWPE